MLPEHTAATLVQRFEREASRINARSERLRDQIHHHVPKTAHRVGAKRVYLFGSLVWGGAHLGTDVDLAVEGLDSVATGNFAAELFGVIDAWLDVVRLETASEGLRERIVEDGCLVFPQTGEQP